MPARFPSTGSAGRRADKPMKTKMLLIGVALGYFITRKRWSVVHNCLVHPLIPIAGNSKLLRWAHDASARKWSEE